jgi:hypothetical protein
MDPKNIILNTEAEALEDILSPFIEEQFPSFIRTDYRKLVLFIKAYYEWLDQKDNAGYVLGKLDTIYDSDRSLDEFYSHFKNTYLLTFPEVLATNPSGNKPNKNTLLKKIRDFYGNKGTESAYKFLFRILYDSDLEIYYPKEDILKVSDGQWVEPKSVKTTSSNGSALFGGNNGQLNQYSGTQLVASAFIESVVQYSFNGLPVTEFFISDINGTFLPGQEVYIANGDEEWKEVAYSVLGDFFVENAGEGYRIGDTATVIDANGVGFSAKIDQVSFAGGVKKIGIANSGINYSGDLVLNIFSESGAQSARVLAVRSAVTNYPGYFAGNRGKISSNKKIQDGHYYQDFSYVLKGEVSFETYFDLLKSIIHPAGMRMFGSVLFKSELDNALTSSAQATYYEVPVIGRYTPYTTGTTIDLRNNGVTASGYWLGATGDLYPLGYNPYIGSTAQVGPNGTTTANGTVFVGSSLGYTWCYVPEGGRTSHNPIGAPLGSTASWRLGHERGPDPDTISGLVLWLKPENIGVCGAVANGVSADVWRDASPSRNDAMPPTWDKWNGVFTSTLNAGAGEAVWGRQVYTTDPITRLQWVFNGLCGGFTTDRLMMVGLNSSDPYDLASSSSYTTIDYSIYSRGPYSNSSSTLSLTRTLSVYEKTVNATTLENAGTNYSAFDNTICEIEYVEPNIVYRVDGVVRRTVFAGYGKTFYMDSSFHNTTPHTARNGHSITILGMWNGINPVVPTASTVNSSAGITSIVYAGVTIDKLRPTLQTAGFGGATGVSFNGGIVFAPASVYAGATLGGVVGLGYTTGTGSSAAAMLSGQHLYLKRPLKITDDADIFVVYKSTRDGLSYGYGLLGSRNTNCDLSANPSVRFDSVLFSRSYNEQDRTAAQQTSAYYSILPNGTVMYPGASLPPAGVFGFRPYGDQTGVLQNTIVYDPHVSGACLGICVGEAVRDSENKIDVFLNGDQGLNKSRSTGRRVASVSPPNTEDYLISKNLIYSFDAGRTACVSEYLSGFSADLLRDQSFVPTPINVLKPVDPVSLRGDPGSNLSAVRVTQQAGTPALGTDEVYKITLAANANFYIDNRNNNVAWRDTRTAIAWTFSVCVRKVDGTPLPSNIAAYIYGLGTNDSAQATIQDIGNGWYRVSRTKIGPSTAGSDTVVSLCGLSFFPSLPAGTELYVGRFQLLPYNQGDIDGRASRTTSSYPSWATLYGSPMTNSIQRYPDPWGNMETVWRAENHSTIDTNAAFNPNGGFIGGAVPIVGTKKYRYSVWVNRKVLGTGTFYFGAANASYTSKFNGTAQTNAYFTANSSESSAFTGKQDTWILVVGHVHPFGTATGGNDPYSGFYVRSGNGLTYAPLSGGAGGVYNDLIWGSAEPNTSRLRVLHYGDSVPGAETLFFRPRIDVVDGTEPSIEDLLNNGVGTVYDTSPSGAISSVFGRPATATNSIVFDGKTTVITTNSDVIPTNSEKMTWEAWVKPSTPTDGELKMFAGSGGLPYYGSYTTANVYFWSMNIGGQKYVQWNAPYNITSRWTHLVFISEYSAATNTTRLQMYANGSLVKEAAFNGAEVYSEKKVSVGDRIMGNQQFYIRTGIDYRWLGEVSMVRVYSRAMTPQEILQNFNSTRGRFGV